MGVNGIFLTAYVITDNSISSESETFRTSCRNKCTIPVCKAFGSEAYSKEELIAEIGASALVNVAGLETAKSFRNSTAYIQNWLSVLRNDKRFIVSASGKAEKAVQMILGTAV